MKDVGQHVDKRERLVNKRTIIMLTLSVAMLLFMLQPSKNILYDFIKNSDKPDVAIAFLEALKRQDQKDMPVLLSIAENHLKVARFQKAIDVLSPLAKFQEPMQAWRAKLINAKSMLGLINTDSGAEIADINLLRENLASLNPMSEISYAKEFANIALQIGEPTLALQFLMPFSSDLLMDEDNYLVELSLQAGQVETAVDIQHDIFIATPTKKNFTELIDLALMAKQWQLGKSIILSFLKRQPSAELLYEQSIRFFMAYGNTADAVLVAKQKAYVTEKETDYLHASQLAISLGDIKMAAELTQKALELNESKDSLEKLHQYHRWLGNLSEALVISQKLTKYMPDELQLRAGLLEASAISDLVAISDFYYLLLKGAWLKRDEYRAWLDMSEKAYGITYIEGLLEQVLESEQDSIELYDHLARLYSYQNRHDKIKVIWQKFRHSRAIDYHQAPIYANAYEQTGNPEQALQILSNVEDLDQADADYLDKLSNLAWFRSDRDILKKIMRLQLRQQVSNIDVYRFLEVYRPIKISDKELFYAVYNKSKDFSVLEEFANRALEQKDFKTLDETIALVSDNESAQLPINFIFIKARATIAQHDDDKAAEYMAQVLALDPHFQPAISESLWFDIDRKNLKNLKSKYPKYKKTMMNKPALWPSLTAAAQILGFYQDAKYWYLKQIELTPQAPALLLNFATVLEILGDSDSAYRIRAHIVTHFTPELLALPAGDRVYRSLIAKFAGKSVAVAMAEKSFADNPTVEGARELFDFFTRKNTDNDIGLWHQKFLLKNFHLEPSQELTLALHHGNKDKVYELINSALIYSPSQQFTALTDVGEAKHAWLLNQEKLESVSGSAEEKLVREQLIGAHPEMAHAIRVEQISFSSWDITQSELGYYRPTKDGHWRLFSRHFSGNMDTPSSPLAKFSANQLEGKYRFLTESGQTEISLLLDSRLGKTSLGFTVNLEAKLSNSISFLTSITANGNAKNSRSMFIVGKEDEIRLATTFKPTSRETIDFQIGYEHYKTLFGDDIADNLSFSITAQTLLFAQAPRWSIYSKYIHEKANISERPLVKIVDVLALSKPLLSNAFIASEYQKLSFGQRFENGIPGQPGALASPIRYWLDSSIEYNFIQQQVEFNLGTGLGLPLFGSDELFMSALWQTADKTGQENINLSMGYYLAF